MTTTTRLWELFLIKQLFPFRRKYDGRLSKTMHGFKILFLLGKLVAETIVMLKTTYGDTALKLELAGGFHFIKIEKYRRRPPFCKR